MKIRPAVKKFNNISMSLNFLRLNFMKSLALAFKYLKRLVSVKRSSLFWVGDLGKEVLHHWLKFPGGMSELPAGDDALVGRPSAASLGSSFKTSNSETGESPRLNTTFGERPKNLRLEFSPTVCKLKFPPPFNFTFNQTLIDLISFSFNEAFVLCINACVPRFNKLVFNWTFCRLLTEKPNCMKNSVY